MRINNYNFINDDIKITFAIPGYITDLMEKAEEADRENNYGLYINYADTIDVQGKLCYTEGVFTEEQWDLLVRRYPI